MPRAVLFDLDRVLIDSRRAWQYALEEAVASTVGRRIDALQLVDEYQYRPWSHALAVVLESPAARARCEALCNEIMRRSALKKLLVHEGIGMAMDSLRAARIEIGASTRLPHDIALKQVQSTGLDRFLTVLSATPAGEQWDAGARNRQCLTYLEVPASSCVLVTAEAADARAAIAAGFRVLNPGWVTPVPRGVVLVATPSQLLRALSEKD